DAWVQAFKSLAGKRVRWQDPPAVGLALGQQQFTFASPAQSLTGKPAEGKWPPCNDVVPKKRALETVRVSARMLAELLTWATAFSPEGEDAVDLHFFHKGQPLGISARNGGLYFDALQMPMV